MAPLKPVTVPGSSAPAVFDAVRDVFDLSAEARSRTGSLEKLSTGEIESFLDLLAALLRTGIVGFETIDVDGKPREVFVSARMAAPELRGRPPYLDRSPR